MKSSHRKLHIATDLDDVTLDFFPSVLEAFRREYGVHIPYDGNPWGQDAVDFGRHPLFLESGYASWWDWLRERDWLWSTFPAVPGAIGGIQRLRAAGHYVELVTAKPEWAEYCVWKWLGKWRPAFNRVTIVANDHRKLDFTDADVIVDDKLQTCREFIDEDRAAILFSRSGHAESIGGLRAAFSWAHVVQQIGEIACIRSG